MNSNDALQNLFDSLSDVPQHKLPPVEKWQPEREADIDITIKADGRWWHEGGEIKRHELVRLFASILVCEDDGEYYLVTPVEKLRLKVEDAPLLIVESVTEAQAALQTVFVRTNLDDAFRIDADHKIEVRSGIPYVYVRRGLWAKVGRNVYYQWIDEALLAGNQKNDDLFIVSAGNEHVIGQTKL